MSPSLCPEASRVEGLQGTPRASAMAHSKREAHRVRGLLGEAASEQGQEEWVGSGSGDGHSQYKGQPVQSRMEKAECY